MVYLLMVFALAYPLLVAELTIGRYGSANPNKVAAFGMASAAWDCNTAWCGRDDCGFNDPQLLRNCCRLAIWFPRRSDSGGYWPGVGG